MGCCGGRRAHLPADPIPANGTSRFLVGASAEFVTQSGVSAKAPPRQEHVLLPGCHRFLFAELDSATGHFDEEHVIGEGGFGRVYRGALWCGLPVAIKRLDRRGLQGDKEFNVEVSILAKLKHPNLVSLLGVCVEGDHRLAVFDLCPGGSLRGALDAGRRSKGLLAASQTQPQHAKRPSFSRRAALEWSERLQVAHGAACGLAFLHEGAEPAIVHRDVKSSNIMLDAAGQARLGDFGIARNLSLMQREAALPHGSRANGHTDTLTGTFGYVAPDAAQSGRLTDKSDVWAFGVVLLELMTGLEPIDVSRPLAQRNLVDWLVPFLPNVEALQEHLDGALAENSVPFEQLAIVADAAAACLQPEASARPSMPSVVAFLQDLVPNASCTPRRLAANAGQVSPLPSSQSPESRPPVTDNQSSPESSPGQAPLLGQQGTSSTAPSPGPVSGRPPSMTVPRREPIAKPRFGTTEYIPASPHSGPPAEPAQSYASAAPTPVAHPLGGFDLLSSAALSDSRLQPGLGGPGVGVSIDSSEATLSSWAASPSQPVQESTAASGSRHFPSAKLRQDPTVDQTEAQRRLESQRAADTMQPAGDTVDPASASGTTPAWPDVRNFDSWQMQASMGAASDDALAAWTTFDDSPRRKKMAARQRATPSAPRMPSWEAHPSHSQDQDTSGGTSGASTAFHLPDRNPNAAATPSFGQGAGGASPADNFDRESYEGGYPLRSSSPPGRRLDQAAVEAAAQASPSQQPHRWESFGDDQDGSGVERERALRSSPGKPPSRPGGRPQDQGSPSGRRSRSPLRHSPGEDTSLAALARQGRQRKIGSPGGSSDTSSPSGGAPLRPRLPQQQQHHLDAQRVRPASPHRPALSDLQNFWQQPQQGLYEGYPQNDPMADDMVRQSATSEAELASPPLSANSAFARDSISNPPLQQNGSSSMRPSSAGLAGALHPHYGQPTPEGDDALLMGSVPAPVPAAAPSSNQKPRVQNGKPPNPLAASLDLSPLGHGAGGWAGTL
ncbi:hypothetical protein WJX74_003608 [Apatococcus lobatus]|uniref:Protein kinase domain-containing protein n=1 Tax=Apatococcus lobatus TaxID=904363 RepID=A0AAW1REM9_9CHLO